METVDLMELIYRHQNNRIEPGYIDEAGFMEDVSTKLWSLITPRMNELHEVHETISESDAKGLLDLTDAYEKACDRKVELTSELKGIHLVADMFEIEMDGDADQDDFDRMRAR